MGIMTSPPYLQVSIHAPREGCDLVVMILSARNGVFQSTHPVRGATCCRLRLPVRCCSFNPRTP